MVQEYPKIFDENEWEHQILHPLWYKEAPRLMNLTAELKTLDEKAYREVLENIYAFFEKHLAIGDIALGSTGKNFDVERKPIDTIIIHHTHGEERMTNERLSAMELLRLYATYYANPTYEQDKEIKDRPIYSGHFRDGKQVFYPYHLVIRKDGSIERLLLDEEIGWHAGNWEMNCRSVAVVFDGNYENGKPSEVELRSAATLIKRMYPNVDTERILGHREVNPKTTCPSDLFLSDGEKQGWRKDILNLIAEPDSL